MRNRIDIDSKDSRAIVREIGERLRALLKEGPELPRRLRSQLTGFAFPVLSAGTNLALSRRTRNAIGEAPCLKYFE
jgi:hypothetical protein